MIQSELSIRPGNRAICSLPPIKGTLAWAPNQNSFLEHDPAAKKAYVLPTDTLQRKEVIKGKSLSSPPSFFPDGRGFAYTFKRGGRSILAIEQYDDPLGDIVNLWEFPYSGSQKAKLAKDHLIFLESDHE
jgi:hypothetical protein